MKQKSLWRISVTTSFEAEEAVTEMLSELMRQPASAYSDAETRRTTVSAYCSVKPGKPLTLKKNLRAGLKRIRDCGLGTAPGRISLTKIRREQWAHSWKRHFHPLEVGSALLVKPSWSRRKVKPGQKLVVLDPGTSFGTGQHPTTMYCLQELVKPRLFSKRGRDRSLRGPDAIAWRHCQQEYHDWPQSFLDIGTGSGILAIAAAKLGYTPVHTIDSNPEAIRTARLNAQRNGVADKIKITRKDLKRLPTPSTWKYDFICANLISTLLIAECGRILARLREGGLLVLAGILKSEFRKVQNVYENAGLKLVRRRPENEWCSGTFLRGR
ncbi:MAG TPA: 50S ribosomal protein L11 methyltransferase [Verrucomicrobiae bacterium]|nr:50S ribosomal protein L11 methyltransferase [Verrucomicrobiae bacterium]